MRAKLSGFLSRDFVGDLAPPMDIGIAPTAEYQSEEIEIENARPLQARSASEAHFFADHAFVMLAHETRVQDWNRDLVSVYQPEITSLIRHRLLPRRRLEITHGPRLTRRGRQQRYYATRIHADGPIDPDGYALNVGAFASELAIDRWRHAYAREEVQGLISIGFWRVTNMLGPLRHMPLALCDPNSVEREDMVRTTSSTVAPSGRTTHHLVLRHNPQQAWYYYPEMTGAELIAMKLCEFRKDDPQAHPQNVFHTAFEDPTTPAEVELRESCEYRVGVMILRD